MRKPAKNILSWILTVFLFNWILLKIIQPKSLINFNLNKLFSLRLTSKASLRGRGRTNRDSLRSGGQYRGQRSDISSFQIERKKRNFEHFENYLDWVCKRLQREWKSQGNNIQRKIIFLIFEILLINIGIKQSFQKKA